MFSFKHLLSYFLKLSALLSFLSISSFVVAAPFTVTYTDTVLASSTIPPYNTGEAFTISIVLDNGGTSVASQTWTSADITSITFTINDAPDTITTVFSPISLTTSTGSFVTNAAGVLTAVPSAWNDNGFPLNSTVLSTNDPDLPVNAFFINSANGVYFSNTNVAEMTNVANNTTAANWSNPVSAGVLAPATAVPALSQWAMIMLSLMLLAIGLLNKIRRIY